MTSLEEVIARLSRAKVHFLRYSLHLDQQDAEYHPCVLMIISGVVDWQELRLCQGSSLTK